MASSLIRGALRSCVRLVDRWPRLRRFLDREVCAARGWRELDHVYTLSRRALFTDPTWRYGPRRASEVASFALDELCRLGPLAGKVYCDLGCGTMNPLGTASFVYLNGADATWSLDVSPVADVPRAAEALFDLLVDCAARPDFWHRSELSRDEYFRRWRRFDLAKLRDGDLHGGLAGLPLRLVNCDIRDNPVPDSSVHFLSSEAVLEHVADLPAAAKRLYALMAPGGVAAHGVDVIDHRWYVSPKRYHKWSFLAEDEATLQDRSCNRLRCGEVIACFEAAGFKALRVTPVREPMPPGFRQRLWGRFASMSDEELETVAFTCVLAKPLAAGGNGEAR